MTEEEELIERWEQNRIAVSTESSGRRRKELLKESYKIALEAERVGWFRLPRQER